MPIIWFDFEDSRNKEIICKHSAIFEYILDKGEMFNFHLSTKMFSFII
jgi:hypothetical protein